MPRSVLSSALRPGYRWLCCRRRRRRRSLDRQLAPPPPKKSFILSCLTLRSGLATSGRTHITGRIRWRNLIVGCLSINNNEDEAKPPGQSVIELVRGLVFQRHVSRSPFIASRRFSKQRDRGGRQVGAECQTETHPKLPIGTYLSTYLIRTLEVQVGGGVTYW